jgi:Subtilase family
MTFLPARPHARVRPGRRAVGASLLAAALVGGLAATGPAAGAVPASAPTGSVRAAGDPGLPTWWSRAMKLPALHRQATGRGVRIAVIDEAVAPRAPELRGTALHLGTDCQGDPVTPATGRILPGAEHGTNVVALLIGNGRGSGPGGRGIRGVAPDAEVTFYGTDFDPRTEAVDCSTPITAPLLREAIAGHPDIITTSLGLGYGAEWQALLKQAFDQGIVVVAASGDRTRPYLPHFLGALPAGYPGVVSVNAGDEAGRAWADNPPPQRLGSVHSYPTVTAPGVDVTGIGFRSGRWVSGVPRTGTSDAAPLVAGALALVKEKYPDATGNQLVQQLVHGTSGGTFHWDRTYGYGLLSPERLLATDPTGWPDENPLLRGPRRALADYPASVYEPAGTGPAASPGGSPTASSGGASTAGSTTGSTTGGSTGSGAGTSAASGAGGAPGWVWPLAALVAVVAAALGAVGVAARRRAGRRTGTRGSRRPTTAAREEG